MPGPGPLPMQRHGVEGRACLRKGWTLPSPEAAMDGQTELSLPSMEAVGKKRPSEPQAKDPRLPASASPLPGKTPRSTQGPGAAGDVLHVVCHQTTFISPH